MELPYAGLHQLCAPMLTQLDALPEPQQARLQRRVRPVVGRRSRPLPGRPRHAEPVGAGRRGAAPALPGRRRAVARRRLGPGPRLRRRAGCWPSRWRSCSPFASRPSDRPFAGPARAAARGAHGRGCARPARDGRPGPTRRPRPRPHRRRDPRQPAGAAGAAARNERTPSWPVASPFPTAVTCPVRSRTATCGASARLPEATQRLMLLAAADPAGDATLVWRAAQTLGIGREAAAPAASEQLLEIGARVRFRHPLVRSAVYRAASAADRRAAHDALAAATDPEADPDRRAWHRAAGDVGPGRGGRDRARALGGPGAGPRRAGGRGRVPGAFGDPDRRSGTPRRADAGRGAGQPPGRRVRCRARACWPRRRPARRTSSADARVDLLRGRVASASSAGSEAPVQLLKAAEAARAARRRAGPRDLPRRVGRRPVRRPSRQRRRQLCSRSHGRRRAAPRPPRPPGPVRPAARRPGDADHRRTRRRRAALAAGGAGVPRRRGPRRAVAPVGRAGLVGRGHPLGLRQLGRGEHPADRARSRRRRARPAVDRPERTRR